MLLGLFFYAFFSEVRNFERCRCIAGRRDDPFRSMEMRTGSIAPMNATSRIGLGVADDESGRRKA